MGLSPIGCSLFYRTGEDKLPIDKILGYEYIYNPSHPLSNKSGKVYVHRIVASGKIGRLISSEEHVHHIDGDKLNNNPENLQIVSNSEHNKIEWEKKGFSPYESHYCSSCGKELYKNRNPITGLCSECYPETNRKFNPTKEELEENVWKFSMVKLSEFYGVSDRAISKRCDLFGIKKPPIGYWARK